MINLQPTLKGELLLLRPLHPNDFDELYAVAADPTIWEQHPENQRYKQDVFKIFFEEGILSKGGLVIIDLKSHKIIGSSRFYDFDSEAKEITIGCTFLKREYW